MAQGYYRVVPVDDETDAQCLPWDHPRDEQQTETPQRIVTEEEESAPGLTHYDETSSAGVTNENSNASSTFNSENSAVERPLDSMTRAALLAALKQRVKLLDPAGIENEIAAVTWIKRELCEIGGPFTGSRLNQLLFKVGVEIVEEMHGKTPTEHLHLPFALFQALLSRSEPLPSVDEVKEWIQMMNKNSAMFSRVTDLWGSVVMNNLAFSRFLKLIPNWNDEETSVPDTPTQLALCCGATMEPNVDDRFQGMRTVLSDEVFGSSDGQSVLNICDPVTVQEITRCITLSSRNQFFGSAEALWSACWLMCHLLKNQDKIVSQQILEVSRTELCQTVLSLAFKCCGTQSNRPPATNAALERVVMVALDGYLHPPPSCHAIIAELLAATAYRGGVGGSFTRSGAFYTASKLPHYGVASFLAECFLICRTAGACECRLAVAIACLMLADIVCARARQVQEEQRRALFFNGEEHKILTHKEDLLALARPRSGRDGFVQCARDVSCHIIALLSSVHRGTLREELKPLVDFVVSRHLLDARLFFDNSQQLFCHGEGFYGDWDANTLIEIPLRVEF